MFLRDCLLRKMLHVMCECVMVSEGSLQRNGQQKGNMESESKRRVGREGGG